MHLTTQQNAVLGHRLNGLSKRSIADQLGLSPHTVDSHLMRLHRKFGVKNAIGLLNAARKETIVIDDRRSLNSEGL